MSHDVFLYFVNWKGLERIATNTNWSSAEEPEHHQGKGQI